MLFGLAPQKRVFFPIMFFAKKILLRRQDKDYALTKTGCVSLKELYKLKYKAVKEDIHSLW